MSKKIGQESQTIEWKWAWQDEFLKWLSGYANTDGGTLYIGVNDDGYVVGVEDAKKMLESIPNKINDKLGIIASVDVHTAYGPENIRYGEKIPAKVSSKLINQYACGEIKLEDLDSSDRRYKTLLTISNENKIWEKADGSREYISIKVNEYTFAISCEGKYYKRSGSTLHELNGFELQDFLLQKAGKSWDEVGVPKVTIEDLSHEAIDVFRKKAVQNNRMPESEVAISDEMLLRKLKLFDGENLSRAAILLFHPDPEQFFTGAYIKIGYFAAMANYGNGVVDLEDLQFQDLVEGPLMMQVDKVIDLIFSKYLKALIDYEGIQRVETYMLTGGIIRELVLNAINHKDYSSGIPIQISVYENRIEIYNTGHWPDEVPADERVYDRHESIPRNPKIANVSFRSGDVESWGRGFIKIKNECEAIKASLPEIHARGRGVSVVAKGCEKYLSLLNNNVAKNIIESENDLSSEKSSEKFGDDLLNETEEAILSIIEKDSSISAASIAKRLNITSRAVEKNIKNLRERGILVRHGAARGGYWEIVK